MMVNNLGLIIDLGWMALRVYLTKRPRVIFDSMAMINFSAVLRIFVHFLEEL